MRKVREVQGLKFERGRRHAEIATSVSIGKMTIGENLLRAREAGPSYEACGDLSELEVERRLFRRARRTVPAACSTTEVKGCIGTEQGQGQAGAGDCPCRGNCVKSTGITRVLER